MFNSDFKQKFKQWGLIGLILLELAIPLSSFAQTKQIKKLEEQLKEDKELLQEILSTPLKRNTIESAMNYFLILDEYCHSKEDSMQLDLRATNPSKLEDTLNIYFNYFHGNFAFPVDTINSKPKITSYYGIRKNPTKKQTGGPNEEFHQGWDIGVYYSPVYSPLEGKVISVGQDKKGGNFIIVGYILPTINKKINFSFMHLKKSYIYVGQKIKKGQKIAKSGNSGITTGAHLHFDIKYLQYGKKKKKVRFIDPKIIYPGYPEFE